MKTNVLIVDNGCSGLYAALNLLQELRIAITIKDTLENSNSFLAQDGICVLKNDSDYRSFFKDTLRAGHCKNDKALVDLVIKSSPNVTKDLLDSGADFRRDENGNLAFIHEGTHSDKRILFYQGTIGKEIINRLLTMAKERPSVTLVKHICLLGILEEGDRCYDGVVRLKDDDLEKITADMAVLTSDGVGGLYRNSTNFKHLIGDASAISLKHDIKLRDMSYVRIHPTTFYQENPKGHSPLISKPVRKKRILLCNKGIDRLMGELQPRGIVVQTISKQTEEGSADHVWESLRTVPRRELKEHFPNILAHYREAGYGPFTGCTPAVSARYYSVGGIKVNHHGKTVMNAPYAIDETACNGVHGQDHLASNSLLGSLVLAKRAVRDLVAYYEAVARLPESLSELDLEDYQDRESLEEDHKKMVLEKLTEQNQLASYIV